MQVTLNETAYQHIRSSLTSGKLAPGERLLTRSLAEEIGVSLAPVREALHRLATEGLIEHIPGAGAFVRQRDRQELEELYVLRDAIESCAASEAARFASDQQLGTLKHLLHEMLEIAEEIDSHPRKRATKTQFARWLKCDERFHQVIVEGSRNRLLMKVISDHRAISAVFEAQRNASRVLTNTICRETYRQHCDLFEALKHRDADRARQLMSQQIRYGQKTLFDHLDSAQSVKH